MDQMVQVQILSLHNYTNIYGTYIMYILCTHTHTHIHTHHLNFQTGLIMSWNQDFQEKYQQAQIGTDDTIWMAESEQETKELIEEG